MSVAVLASAPTLSTDGSDLTQLANKTEPSSASQTIASKLQLKLELTAGTSAKYTVYVMDFSDNWFIAMGVGADGVLNGGSVLDSPGNYEFPIDDLSAHSRIALLKTTDTGGVTTVAQLEEVRENQNLS
jgi:hypothetical protein